MLDRTSIIILEKNVTYSEKLLKNKDFLYLTEKIEESIV